MTDEFDIDFPVSMTGYELDDYLSKGWFRFWQGIFTTNYVELKGYTYPVYWLRISLPKVNYGKNQKKIFARNNAFTLEMKPFLLKREIEDLFDLYKTSIDFETSSVTGILLPGSINNKNNIYNTQMIEIRDGNKLIAVGFFDLGEISVAGILNFYHTDYKSKSLGIYLLLLEIDHAKKQGKEWFYPGYIATGCTKFDYKLFPDKNATEVFDSSRKEWSPFSWSIILK